MIPRRDAGLQVERTVLAWHRTSVALVVNALLALRAGMVADQPLIEALGVLLLLASGSSSLVGAWRRKHLAREGDPVAPPAAAMLAVVVVTWLACLGGLACVTLNLR